MFMAAHPLDQNRLVVVEQLLALDLIPLEAHLDNLLAASSTNKGGTPKSCSSIAKLQ